MKFALPRVLAAREDAKILDTPEKVAKAARELREATAPQFERFRISRRKSLEEAERWHLD